MPSVARTAGVAQSPGRRERSAYSGPVDGSHSEGGPRRPQEDLGALEPLAVRARQTASSGGWHPGSDLRAGRNAHSTNTPDELRAAIDSPANWFEGDLRADAEGKLVMAHDADQEGQGLTFEQWLSIGRVSERGLKIDVKEASALPALLDAVDASGVPDGRIMVNVGAVEPSQAREIRERLPHAWIAITPDRSAGDEYDAEALAPAVAAARAAGGRVTFPLRWDIASDEAIATLRPHGRISIWTSRGEGTPDDAAAETRRLRERGVDGVIDLGPPSSTLEKLYQFADDLWESEPARIARTAPAVTTIAARVAVDAGIDGARRVAGGTLDGARRQLEQLPVAGGWFD